MTREDLTIFEPEDYRKEYILDDNEMDEGQDDFPYQFMKNLSFIGTIILYGFMAIGLSEIMIHLFG